MFSIKIDLNNWNKSDSLEMKDKVRLIKPAKHGSN